MAIVYADQVSEMAIEATYAGRPVVNVMHFKNDESIQNDAATAKDFLNNWQDHIIPILESAYVLTGARYRSLDRNDLNSGTVPIDGTKPTAGQIAGDALPPNVAMLVHKITTGRQRGQREGRWFLAGLTAEAVDDNGSILASAQGTYQAGLDSFLSGVNDAGFGTSGGSGMVVLNAPAASRVKGTQEVDVTSRTVTKLQLDPLVSTQRDRLR